MREVTVAADLGADRRPNRYRPWGNHDLGQFSKIRSRGQELGRCEQGGQGRIT